jgi:hypothetical protein
VEAREAPRDITGQARERVVAEAPAAWDPGVAVVLEAEVVAEGERTI